MIKNLLKSAGLATLVAGMALPAFAAPVLRANVTVSSAIVTVGDMFADAGTKAELALFRAPAPGTSGAVSVDAIRVAAKRAGLSEFDSAELLRVQVERLGVVVDEALLTDLINADLASRGIVTGSAFAKISLVGAFTPVEAATTGAPATLRDLRYTPASGSFVARFDLAGLADPLELRGRLELMINAPHLAANLAAGTILGVTDIEMQPVSLRYADASGVTDISELLGKELRRPARNGMLVRASDVMEPMLVSRSELITLIYRKGALRLTVKGQALNAGAEGDAIAVLNLMTKKIVHGVATDAGIVEMISNPDRIAVAQSQG